MSYSSPSWISRNHPNSGPIHRLLRGALAGALCADPTRRPSERSLPPPCVRPSGPARARRPRPAFGPAGAGPLRARPCVPCRSSPRPTLPEFSTPAPCYGPARARRTCPPWPELVAQAPCPALEELFSARRAWTGRIWPRRALVGARRVNTTPITRKKKKENKELKIIILK
jgi:hypothetical protein